jgi:phage-related minor tail protein|tara:strand:+ start:608 stop:838 length:231 start_codon:yes stop_codon:yes gene_type:complete
MDVVQFSQSLYKVLRERELDLRDQLANGIAQNYEQYRSMVGELQGVATAIDEIKTLLEKTEDDVEDLFASSGARRR